MFEILDHVLKVLFVFGPLHVYIIAYPKPVIFPACCNELPATFHI